MQDSIKADVGRLNNISIVFKLSDQVLECLKLTPNMNVKLETRSEKSFEVGDLL